MKIKQIFWSGLKAFIPLVLTISIVVWLIHTVDTYFGGILRWMFPHMFNFKGAGILLGIVIIFALGILVNAWLIKNLYAMFDRLIKRIPIIKSIYNAIQELVDFFDKDNTAGQQTVLVDLPIGQMLGFITRDTVNDLPFDKHDTDEVLVYLPLSYQIGGVMIVIPKHKLKIVDWPMDTAMSFVLTAGMTKGADPVHPNIHHKKHK